MKKRDEIELIWNNHTPLKCGIGYLSFKDNKYIFKYHNIDSIRPALDNGFDPIMEFPDINKVYTSDRLFITFRTRLPSKRRKDFQEYLSNYGLTVDDDDFYLLQATGGWSPTDKLEFDI